MPTRCVWDAAETRAGSGCPAATGTGCSAAWGREPMSETSTACTVRPWAAQACCRDQVALGVAGLGVMQHSAGWACYISSLNLQSPIMPIFTYVSEHGNLKHEVSIRFCVIFALLMTLFTLCTCCWSRYIFLLHLITYFFRMVKNSYLIQMYCVLSVCQVSVGVA